MQETFPAIDVETENILQLNVNDHVTRMQMLVHGMKIELENDKKNMKQLAKEMLKYDKEQRESLKNTLEVGMDKIQNDLAKNIKTKAQEIRRESVVYSGDLKEVSIGYQLQGKELVKSGHRLKQAEGAMGYKHMYQQTSIQSVYQQHL